MKNIEYILNIGGIYLEVRKLIKFGNSSHVISIPASWLKKNNLNKGDIVYFKENNGNELVLTPEIKKEEKIPKIAVISAKDKTVLQIHREILRAYINNYDTIKINGKELNNISEKIRDILNNLVAVEIMEMTGSEIVAKDFLAVEDSSIEKIIRRIDTIIRAMFEEINFSKKSEICVSINNRDKDVNRLTFLTFRVIKKAQMNPEVLDILNLKEKDLLYYWVMSMSLEKIADDLKRAIQFNRTPNIGKMVRTDITKIYEKIKSNYRKVMQAHYNKQMELSIQVADDRRQDLLECNRFGEKYHDIYGNRVIDEFKDMITHIGDIARIIYINEEQIKGLAHGK